MNKNVTLSITGVEKELVYRLVGKSMMKEWRHSILWNSNYVKVTLPTELVIPFAKWLHHEIYTYLFAQTLYQWDIEYFTYTEKRLTNYFSNVSTWNMKENNLFQETIYFDCIRN